MSVPNIIPTPDNVPQPHIDPIIAHSTLTDEVAGIPRPDTSEYSELADVIDIRRGRIHPSLGNVAVKEKPVSYLPSEGEEHADTTSEQMQRLFIPEKTKTAKFLSKILRRDDKSKDITDIRLVGTRQHAPKPVKEPRTSSSRLFIKPNRELVPKPEGQVERKHSSYVKPKLVTRDKISFQPNRPIVAKTGVKRSHGRRLKIVEPQTKLDSVSAAKKRAYIESEARRVG